MEVLSTKEVPERAEAGPVEGYDDGNHSGCGDSGPAPSALYPVGKQTLVVAGFKALTKIVNRAKQGCEACLHGRVQDGFVSRITNNGTESAAFHE